MKRGVLVVGSLCAMAQIRCGASAPQAEGYVLLDPAARESGATLEVGERAATSALPIAVAADERVTLHAGGREESITIVRGELVYVQGSGAQVSHMKIGAQVAVDQLRLSGEEGAARELARQLGGKVTADGAAWRLEVPGVFAGAALAGVPARLIGAAPVFASAPSASPVLSPPESSTSAPIAGNAPATGAAPAPPLVAFTAATGCKGVGGRWRGRVYSERHAAYYDFTLAVAEGGGSALRGSVVAETWSGTSEEIEPPRGCSDAQHVRVVETATGAVDGEGRMRFDSQTWRVGEHLCGKRMVGYSPDRFTVPLATGASRAHAVVEDDAVWVDGLPVELTRVSCR